MPRTLTLVICTALGEAGSVRLSRGLRMASRSARLSTPGPRRLSIAAKSRCARAWKMEAAKAKESSARHTVLGIAASTTTEQTSARIVQLLDVNAADSAAHRLVVRL